AVLLLNPRDYLPLIVSRNVSDFVGDVHVPVNSGHQTFPRAAASYVEQHPCFAQGVVLVLSVVTEDFQLRAEELLGPVTLLAGVLGRAEVVYGRGYGSWKFV